MSRDALETRWRPVDLACRTEGGDEEMIVRTKLIRDEATAAVCVSEAVSHCLLEKLGLPVADACRVEIGPSFAQQLTKQFEFNPSVQAGGHWGTRYLGGSAQEIELKGGVPEEVTDPGGAFKMYVADVLLACPDRLTYGNALLLLESGELMPIDQSDCLGAPLRVRDASELEAIADRTIAQATPDLDQIVLEKGQAFVEQQFEAVSVLGDEAVDCVEAAPEEWYDRSGASPDSLTRLIAHRVRSIRELARSEYYLGMFDAVGGGHVLDL